VGADIFVDPRTNDALDNEIDVAVMEIDLHSQDALEFHVVPTYERLVDDFRIAPGITLPVGEEYQFTRYRVRVDTAGRRLLSVRPEVEWGNFYSGDRVRISMTSNVRLRPGLLFTLAGEWNKVQLAEGRFYTRLFRGCRSSSSRRSWPGSTMSSSTRRARCSGGSRATRWILQPGNDIYFVYNHNWVDDPLQPTRFRSLDNRLSSKLLYTYRF
jgi:hypothetical protein